MRDLLLALRLDAWVLAALLAWPAAGAALTFLLGRAAPDERAPGLAGWRDPRTLATAVLAVEALLALALWAVFDPGLIGWQATVDLPLVPRWGARLSLGVDGMSLVMVMLTALLMPLAVLGSRTGDARRARGHHALLLLLVTGIVGVLVTLDLLLLATFWALVVGTTYLAIGRSEGAGRARAAHRYLAVVGGASLLLLAAVGVLWVSSGSRTFALDPLLAATRGSLSTAGQAYLFGAFVLAFAAGSAAFPLHVWLPAVEHEVPASLAAALGIEVGAYGILRFALPFFPAAATHPALRLAIVAVTVVGIVYCALLARREPDLARLASYASVGHTGLVVLGIFSLDVEGVQGAMVAMVAHGVSLGAMLLLAGIARARWPAGAVRDLAGIGRTTPLMAGAATVAALGVVGLPGTNGFVATFLVLRGAYRTYPVAAAVAGATVALAAAYLLRALRRMILGPASAGQVAAVPDLDRRELFVMALLAVAIVWVGVAPGPVLRRTEGAAQRIVEQVTRGAAAVPVAVGRAESR